MAAAAAIQRLGIDLGETDAVGIGHCPGEEGRKLLMAPGGEQQMRGDGELLAARPERVEIAVLADRLRRLPPGRKLDDEFP